MWIYLDDRKINWQKRKWYSLVNRINWEVIIDIYSIFNWTTETWLGWHSTSPACMKQGIHYHINWMWGVCLHHSTQEVKEGLSGPQQVQDQPGPRLARKRHFLKQKRKPAQGDNEENSNGWLLWNCPLSTSRTVERKGLALYF